MKARQFCLASLSFLHHVIHADCTESMIEIRTGAIILKGINVTGAQNTHLLQLRLECTTGRGNGIYELASARRSDVLTSARLPR